MFEKPDYLEEKQSDIDALEYQNLTSHIKMRVERLAREYPTMAAKFEELNS